MKLAHHVCQKMLSTGKMTIKHFPPTLKFPTENSRDAGSSQMTWTSGQFLGFNSSISGKCWVFFTDIVVKF